MVQQVIQAIARGEPINWADLCKSIRTKRGTTQEQIAHSYWVTVQTWRNWEGGRKRPIQVFRVRLLEEALALNITVMPLQESESPDR